MSRDLQFPANARHKAQIVFGEREPAEGSRALGVQCPRNGVQFFAWQPLAELVECRASISANWLKRRWEYLFRCQSAIGRTRRANRASLRVGVQVKKPHGRNL